MPTIHYHAQTAYQRVDPVHLAVVLPPFCLSLRRALPFFN